MTHHKIIGIAAKARSGKDSVASVLIENCGYMRYGFSDPIKRALADWMGLSVIEIEMRKREDAIRKALQFIGTDVGRKMLGKDIWINYLKPRAMGALKIGYCVVVPDVRFCNEADAIRDWGGVVWGVRRPNNEDELKGDLALHASESEVELITPDQMFVNDGSVDDLRTAVREAMGVASGKEA